jgi:hypothetical protein
MNKPLAAERSRGRPGQRVGAASASTFLLVLPEIAKPLGRKFAISNRMLDVLVAEIVLQRIMQPAPRQKPPQISPIFISDKVTLHVSREKDRKLRLGYAGMGRCEGRSSRTAAGKLTPGRGSDAPPSKTRTPLRPPLVFSSDRWRSRASNRAFFALAFEVALRVTAPSIMRNGSPLRRHEVCQGRRTMSRQRRPGGTKSQTACRASVASTTRSSYGFTAGFGAVRSKAI